MERMAFESDKTMFEIYRDLRFGSHFRVVYFTELQDHNKESEINRAMAGSFNRNFQMPASCAVGNSSTSGMGCQKRV